MKIAHRAGALFCILVLAAGCAHDPGSAGAGTALSDFQKILRKNELVVGMTGKQPPLNMKSKEGVLIGLEPALARAMAGAMGVALKIELMDFYELFPALESGRVDMVMSGMTMTPKRNLQMAFVGPYFVTGKSLLTKADHIAKCQELCDIDSPQTSLTFLKGSNSQFFAEKIIPKARMIPARDYDEAVNLVLEDKADALIADLLTCLLALARHPNRGLLTSLKTFTFEPLGIALPGTDPLLINWTENFLKIIQGTGELKKLSEFWIKNEVWLQEKAEPTHDL
ncbi:MAG: transporter substrate-binding domain-containing protein [Desulfobacterota bacterium]|nr:transporter substrate-binding domain-containing protein [Thermodesulfobacteriota bacterium]